MDRNGEQQLEILSKKFCQWRSRKKYKYEKIPKNLWSDAIEICQFVKPGRVSKILGLNHQKLVRCIAEGKVNPAPGFIMLEANQALSRNAVFTLKGNGEKTAVIETDLASTSNLLPTILAWLK